MAVKFSAPLLGRVKSWQLIAFGITGWCTLYSVALLAWGASSNLVGNTQGGCFAATMTLASMEANRNKKRGSQPPDPLQWVGGVSTEQLNQILARTMEKREFRVEACHRSETELGFGLRVINSGRSMVLETARWQEPIVDLCHAQTTEANRKAIRADLAIIVGAGAADEETRTFVKTCPVRLLIGDELKALVEAEKGVGEIPPASTAI